MMQTTPLSAELSEKSWDVVGLLHVLDDVDPDDPRLRPLWRAPGHPGPTTLVFTEIVGLDRGAPPRSSCSTSTATRCRRSARPAATGPWPPPCPPYLAVRWTDHDPHARDHGWAEACIDTVDPHRGLLTACTPRP